MKIYHITFTPALRGTTVEAKNKKEAEEIAWDNFDMLAQGYGDVRAEVKEVAEK